MNKLTIGQPTNMFIHALAGTVTLKTGYVTYHLYQTPLLNINTLTEWSFFINSFFYDYCMGVVPQ